MTVLTTTGYAQKNISYPVVVSFNSMCCGVPDNGPVMKLIKSFKKQHKIKRMAADSIGLLKDRRIVQPRFIDDLLSRRLKEHSAYYGTMVWVLMMLGLWLNSRKL